MTDYASLEALASALSGSLAGGIATASLYPLDTLRSIVSSQQSEGRSTGTGVLATAQQLVETEGAGVLYRGISYKLFKSMFGKLCYFYGYSFMRSLHLASNGGQISLGANLLYGYLAEWAHMPITQPADVICTRMQAGASKGSLLATLKDLYSNSGFRGFYKGVNSQYVLCLQPAIQFTIFDTLKKKLMSKSGGNISAAAAFWLGALARGVAICITFPYLRAKTVIQTRKKSARSSRGTIEPTQEETMTGIIKDIIASSGFSSLYIGLGPELVRAVLSSALMFMLKEKIYSNVRKLVQDLNKLR